MKKIVTDLLEKCSQNEAGYDLTPLKMAYFKKRMATTNVQLMW